VAPAGLRLDVGQGFDLVHIEGSRFIAKGTMTELEFHQDGMEQSALGARARFRKLEPRTPSAVQFDHLVGDYTSEELGVTWGVTAEDGALTLVRPRGVTTALSYLSDGYFSFEGMLAQFDGSGLLVSHPRASGIRFTRR
jgi:hypothetical protein